MLIINPNQLCYVLVARETQMALIKDRDQHWSFSTWYGMEMSTMQVNIYLFITFGYIYMQEVQT